MSIKKFVTQSSEETSKVAQDLAQEILAKGPGKKATIAALSGELGAGKTTFVQGFAKALGIEEKILSPTFVVMKRFDLASDKQQATRDKSFKNFYHIDCYRLEEDYGLVHLGFEEIINNPENIVAIEWPEKISSILLSHEIIQMTFITGSDTTRTIEISH